MVHRFRNRRITKKSKYKQFKIANLLLETILLGKANVSKIIALSELADCEIHRLKNILFLYTRHQQL